MRYWLCLVQFVWHTKTVNRYALGASWSGGGAWLAEAAKWQ